MSSYVINIIVEGKDHASPALHQVQSGLTGMLSVAGGALLAGAVQKLGSFFSSLAGGALESVGHTQNLEIAMESLLTRANMYQQVNEVHREAIGLTAEETQRLAELQSQMGVQNAQLKEQEQRVWEMTNVWGEQGLATETARARLADMRIEIQGTEQDIGKLLEKQGSYATTTETSWQKTMEFADAQALAKVQAADLLSFVEKLAIVSPFETNQVEIVTKLGLAANMSTDQVKSFTEAFLDQAAVVGINSENLAFAADQFLQLRKVGKLTEIDLRQLRRMGIDVAQVLGVEMGMSVEEFNKKVEESPELMDQLFDSFVKFTNETSKGAAQRMATSVPGMMSTMHDAIEMGSRKLFRPIIEAISPFAANLLGKLAEAVTGGKVAALGQKLADKFMVAFDQIMSKGQELFAAFQEGGVGGLVEALGLGPDATELILKILADLQALGAFIQTNIMPIFGELGGQVMPLLGQAIAFINEHWEAFRNALIAIGAVLAGVAIAGTIASIGAAIAALVTPVGIIVAVVGLLAAAWTENWFGIRDILTEFWENTARPILEQLWAWLQVNVPLAIQYLSDFWQTTLLPALQVVWTFINETLIPILSDIWNWLSINIPIAIQTLSDFWNLTLLPALQAVWAFINDLLLPLIIALVDLGLAVAEKATEALTIVWETRLYPWLQKVWAFIQDNIMPIFKTVGDEMRGPLASAVQWVKDKFEAFTGVLERVKEIIKQIIEKIHEMADAISNLDLGALAPGSPSPFEISLTGVNKALREMNTLANANPVINGRMGDRTTNNYFAMTVNTRAEAGTVRQDFEIMRAMAG